MQDEDRFWSKVDKSGGSDACWPWTAGTYKGGYGQFWCKETKQGRRAHAVALELHTGEVAGGRLACHTCDNPGCCNPAHLWWGTQQTNTADRQAKGRGAVLLRRERWNAKLTPEIVKMCRERYDPGSRKNGSSALAREFGVSQSTMHLALTGKQWSHIT